MHMLLYYTYQVVKQTFSTYTHIPHTPVGILWGNAVRALLLHHEHPRKRQVACDGHHNPLHGIDRRVF